jgi:3-phenylpropionate/trans-cinnamate dioxygenase ferredoxin reductase component
MIETTDVLLVGGGVASVRCARTLRREGFGGRIMVVGDEPTSPYNRPPLSKELLRDDLPDDLVLAEPERWYERRGVELTTGRRVIAVDPSAQEATLDDDTRLRFDRCLLATGATPRLLSVAGGEHALLLRTLDDARRLRRAATAAAPGSPVVVVGGGFIGLEVASSLAVLGLRPTIVELGAALWAGTLGVEPSRWALDALDQAGIGVRLGSAVTRIEPKAAWIGEERLDAEFTVAGIGVVPRDELAMAAGLEVDDGIVTDGAHRTGHPAVWAAGDVARRAGRRIEHWHAAREGGERAAHSMLGLDPGSEPAPWLFSEVAGHAIDVVGAAGDGDDERVLGTALVAFLVGRRVTQIVIIDGAVPVAAARSLVERGCSLAELERLA